MFLRTYFGVYPRKARRHPLTTKQQVASLNFVTEIFHCFLLVVTEMETKVLAQCTIRLAWPRAAEEVIVFALCASSTVVATESYV